MGDGSARAQVGCGIAFRPRVDAPYTKTQRDHMDVKLSGSRTASPREASQIAGEGGATSCTLNVGGMDCSSCAESVDKALRSLEGVQDVRVDVVDGKVQVEYAEGKLARGDLAGAIRRVGYRVKDDAPAREASFTVDGMCCASEVRQIEGKLADLPGITQLKFDPVQQRLGVVGEVAPAEIERAIAELGMKARLVGEGRAEESWWERRGRLVLAFLSGLFWAGSLAADHLLGLEWLVATLAIAAVVSGGWYVFPRGYRAVTNRALDMNFLMSVAAVGAIIIGAYEEAGSLMFLFAVAQLLETYSMDRARNAIKALMDLAPAEATVLRNGQEVRIPADQVEVGEVVLVRPGGKIPVDGEVIAGASSVNQAAITGESIPIEKDVGAEVFAGTLNGEGALEIRSTKPASDTTLARIIHSVEEAQATRAPSQTFVDRFARVYTPLVVASAILIAIAPPLLGLGDWGEWSYRALVLLVVGRSAPGERGACARDGAGQDGYAHPRRAGGRGCGRAGWDRSKRGAGAGGIGRGSERASTRRRDPTPCRGGGGQSPAGARHFCDCGPGHPCTDGWEERVRRECTALQRDRRDGARYPAYTGRVRRAGPNRRSGGHRTDRRGWSPPHPWGNRDRGPTPRAGRGSAPGAASRGDPPGHHAHRG
jgi:copper chaperone CopZ